MGLLFTLYCLVLVDLLYMMCARQLKCVVHASCEAGQRVMYFVAKQGSSGTATLAIQRCSPTSPQAQLLSPSACSTGPSCCHLSCKGDNMRVSNVIQSCACHELQPSFVEMLNSSGPPRVQLNVHGHPDTHLACDIVCTVSGRDVRA